MNISHPVLFRLRFNSNAGQFILNFKLSTVIIKCTAKVSHIMASIIAVIALIRPIPACNQRQLDVEDTEVDRCTADADDLSSAGVVTVQQYKSQH